jgi:hypothetical protein
VKNALQNWSTAADDAPVSRRVPGGDPLFARWRMAAAAEAAANSPYPTRTTFEE